ncbi:amino acid ABC transporter ATP-binding protein [Mycetocola tolaasinivorans]|uniref:Amino acid ABC transporter ATP-binding protein n=1 Tax=Mycetocola tolaasinivorans TaxID=76635 RepID=A0A3L7ABW0_9MICO|nr:amino acid ABC transporter ATP-binding protein [Mycetocola tolaasinivorans]RLP76872.1 amino acid ABC transporter ATP-binding protein [Mycetocola tolaasinivorans]
MSGVAAVSIRNLSQAYGSHLTLKNISLDVAPHEVVALIGPSGCGKSTLLRTINLLEESLAGEILVHGEPVSGDAGRGGRDSVRRRVGMVFQQFNLFPHLTVLQNITLAPRKLGKLSRSEADAKARALLARFGLADKADEYPDRLSGGQQQRVAILRALATEPEVILLDEVTSALDPETVGEVLALIRELRELGLTLILATHELQFARTIADRIVFLSAGEIVEQGTPGQILDTPQHPRTRQFVASMIHPESAPSAIPSTKESIG